MKKFIVHIGYPKTATTTLQKNIFMKHCNHRYMGKKYEEDNISNELNKIIESLLFDSETVFDINLPKYISIIKEYSMNVNEKIILSNEILSKKFYWIIANRLSKLFNLENYSSCEVVITLRNQKELIFSQYVEKYKGDRLKFNLYLENGLKSPYDNVLYSVYDFYEIYNAYIKIFGSSSVHLLLYEDLQHKPKTFANRLSQIIDVSEDIIYNEITTKSENIKKKDSNYLYKKISINSYLSKIYTLLTIDFLSYKQKQYIKKLFSKILIEKKIPKIREEEKEFIAEYFAQSNKLLSQQSCLNLVQYGYPYPKDNISIEDVKNIAIEAGDAIMEIYNKDFLVEYKHDKSPLTEADLKANATICSKLQELYPNIPIMSEENKQVDYKTRKNWEYYWCIDPIDGTKEFIKKNNEFTVNIALIHKDTPVLGVVYAPAIDKMYWAKRSEGAYLNGEKLPLQTNDNPKEKLFVVASKSHLSAETQEFIDSLEAKKIEQVSKGSSLKLCMVATGEADIYPRLAPTMEWDTAAADAIVREAGKMTYQFDSDEPVVYNKEELLNPWFVVK